MNAEFLPSLPSGKSTRRLLAAMFALAVVLVAGLGALVVACSGAETTTTATTTAGATTTTQAVTTTLVASTVYVTTTEAVTTTQPGALASTRYEATDPHLGWDGNWIVRENALGTTYTVKFADSAGASVTIKFRGTKITLIAGKEDLSGIARVSLDNNAAAMVDLYAPHTDQNLDSEVWSSGNLASGDHVVVIECTGTKNPASGGTYVVFNAVDVIGTLQ